MLSGGKAYLYSVLIAIISLSSFAISIEGSLVQNYQGPQPFLNEISWDGTQDIITPSLQQEYATYDQRLSEYLQNLTQDQRKIHGLLSIIDDNYPRTTDMITVEDEKHNLYESGLLLHSSIREKDSVLVYIRYDLNASKNFLDHYIQNIQGRMREGYSQRITGWVALDDIEKIAYLPEVSSIDLVTPPTFLQGLKLTEGDSIHNVDQVRSIYGAKGNGKRVGVISNGVNNISLSQQSGDIPSGVHILNDAAGGGNEGTAMLEILYDLAPNAEYYFHAAGPAGGASEDSFFHAMDELAEIM